MGLSGGLMTNGGGASIASSASTSTTQAPTDSSTKIATTAFTKAALPTVTLEQAGAIGDGTTDDTAAFQACANLGAVRITGTHLTYKVTGQIVPHAGNYWDLWGITVTTTNTTQPIFNGGSSDGVTFNKSFTLLGGHLVGSGIGGSSNRSGVNLLQWTDSQIIGTEFSNFTDNATMHRSCTRVLIAFTTTHDCCHAAGQNAHNVTDFVPTGQNQTTGEFTFIGNFSYGNIPTAPASINATFGGYTSIDALVAFNTLESSSAFSCVFSEVNPYTLRTDTATVTNASATVTDAAILAGDLGRPVTGTGIPANTYVGTVTPGVSFLLSSSPSSQVSVNATNNGVSVVIYGDSQNRRVIISDNILINTSTGSTATCFYALDDSANYFNDPLKLAEHIVQDNIMYCASNVTGLGGGAVIQFAASRCKFDGNLIIAAGTNGRCVMFKANATADPAAYQHVTFSNNDLYQTNTAATARMVEFNGPTSGSLSHVKWSGGKLVSSITAQAGVSTADAFWVGGNVQHMTIENLEIVNAGNNALNVTTPTNLIIQNVKIYNCNACNNVSSSAGNGIFINGVGAGTVNEMTNVKIYDDRGTHQMYQGVQAGSSSTTKFVVRGLTIRGALNAPMNTPVTNWLGSITGYESDVLTGYGFNATSGTVGASPLTTTAQPYDQAYYIRAINGTTIITESRNTQNLPIVAGMIYIRRNETITITWATTAPTFSIVPLP